MHLPEFLQLLPTGLLLKHFNAHLVLIQKIIIPCPERKIDQITDKLFNEWKENVVKNGRADKYHKTPL